MTVQALSADRRLVVLAARERPHRGREREDDAEDGEHDEAPVGGVCLHGHALLLTVVLQVGRRCPARCARRGSGGRGG